ncbi:hypothetical protein [Corallococcus sicarius]|uniref:hypothetical protein n=1 Tax=Corallococcus sicarius TaxID=2316726 RepID=UPI0011C43E59|nr:hypothetical protein [Corallococcus sicarius]
MARKKDQTTAQTISTDPAEQDDGQQTSPDSPSLFADIKKSLATKHKNRDLLISIPIWGWTGDGKTVALLASHYSLDVLKHGLSLALINNTYALQKMEAESEAYRGLNLVAAAATTKNRITPLIERFIEGGEWPPGTDEGSPYLFDLRTIFGTVGYLLMPDLRGGSYREGDEQAREVLRTAHACIILVRPEQFIAETSDGKRYRDAVIGQIQDSAALKIPTAVMITQADKYPDTGSAADTTHNHLTILLEQHDDFPNSISRVSVVGKKIENGQLPPITERVADSLLRPVAWILWQALQRPKNAIHSIVPSISLQPTEVTSATEARATAPELRAISEKSNAPGIVIAAASTAPRTASFIFLDNDGFIFETELSTSSNQDSRFSKSGQLTDFDIDTTNTQLQATVDSGNITLGQRVNANWIWHGPSGSQIQKTSLPAMLSAWASIGPGHIVGVDASGSGRLGSFRLSNGKWQLIDHVGGFLEQTPILTLGYLPRSMLVIAMNGKESEGVLLRSDGSFGDRVTSPVSLQYDSAPTHLNEVGMAASITTTNTLNATATEKTLSIPKAADGFDSLAVAKSSPIFSAVLKNMQLATAKFVSGNWAVTEAKYSPQLEEMPVSMQWSPDGRLLVATFGGGRWTSYRPFGLGA